MIWPLSSQIPEKFTTLCFLDRVSDATIGRFEQLPEGDGDSAVFKPTIQFLAGGLEPGLAAVDPQRLQMGFSIEGDCIGWSIPPERHRTHQTAHRTATAKGVGRRRAAFPSRGGCCTLLGVALRWAGRVSS